MPTVVFWNVAKKNHGTLVGKLANQEKADIVVLAESTQRTSAVEAALTRETQRNFAAAPNQGVARVRVFSSLPPTRVRQVYETKHHVTYKFTPLRASPFTLMSLHLRSKLHMGANSQALASTRLRTEILEVERLAGTTDTLVLGDFNMNPFEAGMVGAPGLHAMMDLRIAEQGSRIVDGTRYEYFYNPMWSLLGDRNSGPTGTYYRRANEEVCFHWNMLDQLLLRPGVLQRYKLKRLVVVDAIGTATLLSPRGLPKKGYSDHLPITFRLTRRV